MAVRTIHLCPYNFKSSDPVVIGSEVDGGTSLSGIQDVVETSGGGYWQWSLSNGSFGGRPDERREVALSWRAINAGLSGGAVAVFRFCDRHHQPVYGRVTVPHSDNTPFSDDTEYVSAGAAASVLAVVNGQVGGLNATIIDIVITSERVLIGGEKFGYIGAGGWGDRVSEISSVEDIPGGKRIRFHPPIRGGVAIGDPLDFDDPKLRMRRVSQPSSALDPLSQTTSVSSLVLIEDMRDPDL